MTLDEFSQKLRLSIPPGLIFANPGGGTSEIISVNSEKISYRRKSSTMTITIKILYEVFSNFNNSTISSSDLKTMWPSVFDSKARPAGHSCNVTFLFICLKQMSLISEIHGGGVRGNPYYVDLRQK